MYQSQQPLSSKNNEPPPGIPIMNNEVIEAYSLHLGG